MSVAPSACKKLLCYWDLYLRYSYLLLKIAFFKLQLHDVILTYESDKLMQWPKFDLFYSELWSSVLCFI